MSAVRGNPSEISHLQRLSDKLFQTLFFCTEHVRLWGLLWSFPRVVGPLLMRSKDVLLGCSSRRTCTWRNQHRYDPSRIASHNMILLRPETSKLWRDSIYIGYPHWKMNDSTCYNARWIPIYGLFFKFLSMMIVCLLCLAATIVNLKALGWIKVCSCLLCF